MRIVVTGASGTIGSQLVEELSPFYEVTRLDCRRAGDSNTVVADLSRPPSFSGWRSWFLYGRSNWDGVFAGADVVVHLAANSQSLAPWEKVLPDNVQATWNVMAAAAKRGVRRVVFASSNWAVKLLEQRWAPDCYRPDGPKIGSDTPPCPVNDYGFSKAFGEITGRMFVDEKRLESVAAVRIGSYHPEPPDDEHVRTRWIGTDDIRAIFRRCVEADFKGYHVVYGVSAQSVAPYDLSHTRHLLSWTPQQTFE